MDKCPKCGSTLSDKPDYCINCGEKLTTICPGCKKRIQKNSSFCIFCRTMIR